MKFLHTADLHLGKKLNQLSLLDDQKYILYQIIDIAVKEKADAILVSGDIYDHGIPSQEAQMLFEDFIIKASILNIPMFIIKGNHDSDRLGYAKKFISQNQIFINENLVDSFKPIVFKGTNIFLLPYFSLYQLRGIVDDETAKLETLEDGYKYIFQKMNIDKSQTNILLAHDAFLPSGATDYNLAGSELADFSIGSLTRVDASILADFDYVALGHIHKPQTIMKDKVRYAGSILKYHPKEARDEKSVTLVEINNKKTSVSTIKLVPQRDLKEIEGMFDSLMERGSLDHSDDYVYVKLDDKVSKEDAVPRLRTVYPNIIGLEYPNISYSSVDSGGLSIQKAHEDKPEDLFNDFFKAQNLRDLSLQEKKIVLDAFKSNEKSDNEEPEGNK
jgi:exonuclease SbcD